MDGTHNTHVRILREGALLLGGQKNLAQFLDIEEWLLSRWLEGLGHPPDFISASCSDLIESKRQSVSVTTQREEDVRCCR